MNWKQIGYGLLFFFLLLDVGYSFLQHYFMPLDGDLATSVLISEYSAYKPLMNDPFGFGIIARDTSWPNPNRFFGHWFLSVYMRHVPLILQAFASPINSVYLACAIIKTLIQVAFIYLLAGYISGKWNAYNRQFILAAILITPLLQASGYNSYMGIIDQSITYTFFYALPLCLLLLFYLRKILSVVYLIHSVPCLPT